MSVAGWLRISVDHLRQRWLLVVESTAAATGAWFLDTRFVGHPQPFFAPAAAIIVLAQVRGQRTRRAVEVLLGVAGGVLVADAVIQALGPHNAWTIVTVILLTLTVAVAVGASTVALVQAAVSAVYLVVVAPPTPTAVPLRFVDALVGGAVALLASQLAAGRDPVAPLVRESGQIFDELASVLEQVAAALDRHDENAAREALDARDVRRMCSGGCKPRSWLRGRRYRCKYGDGGGSVGSMRLMRPLVKWTMPCVTCACWHVLESR